MGALYKAYQLKNDMRDNYKRRIFIQELQKMGIRKSFDGMTDRELLHLLSIERLKRE